MRVCSLHVDDTAFNCPFRFTPPFQIALLYPFCYHISHPVMSPCSPNKTRQFENFVYLTQVVQMVCITAEIEHYRRIRNESHTMGTLYWQLVRVIMLITIRCACSCMYMYII